VRWRGVTAVDRVSFEIAEGETLGLVGESGCGKSTLARALTGLAPIAAGTVRFGGVDLLQARGKERLAMRRAIQLVFQDPLQSLNPRQRIGAIVAEGIEIHRLAEGAAVRERVARLLARVGLPSDCADRWPHQLSGGQRQRVGVARALSVEPRLLLCDEAVASLDLSVRAGVLDLLLDLRERDGLSCLFISHDLALVAAMSQRLAVMHLGELVEVGPTDAVMAAPRHPLTRALAAAAAALRGEPPESAPLTGEPPAPSSPPSGCRFHPRCPVARPECRAAAPPERTTPDGRRWRCVE
jgi:oligopeptide/dipeptide ABC transporter ATP-binding protein